MSTYLCRWPNGDVSFVTGKNRQEIDCVLDEVGNADGAELIPLTHAAAIHFRLNIDASDQKDYLTLEHFDEKSSDVIAKKVYPVLTEAIDKMVDEKGDYHHDQTVYKAALKAEVKRVRSKDYISSRPGIAHVQTLMDMPKSVIEGLKKHAKKT